MLLFGLVHRTRRVRIPLPPERFDEVLALFERLQYQEEIPLRVRDDVSNLLFDPGAVLGRQAFQPLFPGLRRQRRGKRHRQHRTNEMPVHFVHG